MAYIIKFENVDGTKFETPVIEDTNRGRRRPNVIENSPERKEWIEKNQDQYKTKKKSKKKKRVV